MESLFFLPLLIQIHKQCELSSNSIIKYTDELDGKKMRSNQFENEPEKKIQQMITVPSC